jgi:alkylated DNA repair dioxygenase AlkB
MMPLQYQWFLRGKPTGEPTRLELQHGDLYIMSEKATGNDWKKRVIPTLRHVAGDSFIKKEVKKLKKK